MKKRYLVLADGTVFEGKAFGAECDGIGELVFNTGVVGYIETLTDPGYYGQIIVQTFPLIGNYGIIESDFEGKCCVKGYVVREYCDAPSNFRCEYGLDKFLKDNGVPGICGVDTRRLTKIIRENGVMNAMLCDEVPAKLDDITSYRIIGAAASVSCEDISVYEALGEEKAKIALIDCGVRKSIINSLTARGCSVTVFPADKTAEEILASEPDGIVISNGPGDPEENVFQIAQIQKLMGKKPIFGIGLGHQLLAIANGGESYKMLYGHRGSSQPVKDLLGTRTYITSQNHGYAIKAESVKNAKLRFANANDGSCEGLVYPGLCAVSVQFIPENASGPQGTAFMFDEFIAMMGGKN